MKVCFIGLGSIGKRHLVNFKAVAEEFGLEPEVHALRSSRQPLAEEIAPYVDRQFFDTSQLEDYDIIFITNPTYLHYQTLMDTVAHTTDMFIEKPLFHSHQLEVCAIPFKPDSIYYVACPLRYHPVITYLKNYIIAHPVFSVRSMCSSYLPDWRRGVDYRQVYSSNGELGGGVSLDLIHEIDYITHLFGFPARRYNIRDRVSNLEISSDDLSVYILQYKDKLVEIHLDYFGRVSRRQVEMVTADDVIVGDMLQNKISFLKSRVEECLPNEDMYQNEMCYFLKHILERSHTHNEISHARHILELAGEGSR